MTKRQQEVLGIFRDGATAWGLTRRAKCSLVKIAGDQRIVDRVPRATLDALVVSGHLQQRFNETDHTVHYSIATGQPGGNHQAILDG